MRPGIFFCYRSAINTIAGRSSSALRRFLHEFILNNDKTGPLFPALFSINMLLGTPGGRACSERELMDILEKNGAADVKRLDVKAAVTSGIVCGRAEG